MRILVKAYGTGDGAHRACAPLLLLAVAALEIPCAFPQSSPCTLTPSSVSLGAAGTASAGGVLPEIPQSLAILATGSCGTLTAAAAPTYIGAGICGMPASVPNHWLTASASGGTLTFTALTNSSNAPRTATITINSGSGANTTVTVAEAGDTESQVQRTVRALYQDILFRDPDAAGFAFWTGNGLAGLGQMVDDFLTSPEAFNLEFAVLAAYQATTGAAPGYAQFWAATADILAGMQTIPGLYLALLSPGATATASTVTNLNMNLLNRAPTPAEILLAEDGGLAGWFQNLIGYAATTSNSAPIGAVANEFQSTGTFHIDHTNGLYIVMLYFVILSRDYDIGGYNFWLGIANSGGPGILFQGPSAYPTRIQIIGTGVPLEGFIGSAEFSGPISCPEF